MIEFIFYVVWCGYVNKEKDRFTLPENHPLAKIGLKVRALQRTLSTLNRRIFIREGGAVYFAFKLNP